MADLRIVDAPVLLQESITDDVKMPTGGLGNYAIRLGDLVWYVVQKEQLASKNYVDLSSKGVKDSLDVHIANKENPHQVTKAQVGLGNVDNTADIDKPVSNAVNSAIITATTDMATKAYVNSRDGDLSTLKTADKTNLVKAINEVVSVKADKATTLVGYGISDAYTKSEIDTDYSGVKTLYGKNVEAGAGANGWDANLVVYGKTTQRQVNDGLESIAQLIAVQNPRNGQRVYVKSYHAGLNAGGGEFVYDSTKSSINDGGMVINGWVRQVSPHYLNVMNFGAKGDGVTNDCPAFKAVSDYVKNTNFKGYTIHLPTPPDHYAVSGQTFEVGKGFTCEPILDISFTTLQDKFILLQSDNAKIKQMSGQYFGAFDKNTKEKLNTTTPVYYGSGANYDTVKDVATTADLKVILHFENIKSLIINGKIDLDGNRDGMNIGGVWGDTGWQLFAYGIRIAWVKQFDISNINSHHHCCDGIYIAGWNDFANPDKPLADVKGVARNLNSQYNSRQGMSLTGGQNISFYDCIFDNTALPEFSLQSMPRSGVDIEAEVSPVRNISFYNSYFGRAGSLSMVADAGNEKDVKFYNCKFINDIGGAVWANRPQFKFYDCYINGFIEKNYATEIDSDRTIYQDCIFTDDPIINPNFSGREYLFIASGANPKLINCTMNLHKSGMIYSYGTSAKYPILFDNLIINAYYAWGVAISGIGTIRLRDYRPQANRTEKYITFGGNIITVAIDKTDDIGNKFIPYGAYATVNSNVEDPDYLVFAPQVKKLDAVANSTLTDDTATKLNALLTTLKAKGYM